MLEQGEQAGALARLADDLPLFAATARAGRRPLGHIAGRRRAGRKSIPTSWRAKEPLELLYKLRAWRSRDLDALRRALGGRSPWSRRSRG